MAIHKDKDIIDLLESRDGIETRLELIDGNVILVYNIAWGYDIDDEAAHITTNISPMIEKATIDFFYSSQIKKILDGKSSELLISK